MLRGLLYAIIRIGSRQVQKQCKLQLDSGPFCVGEDKNVNLLLVEKEYNRKIFVLRVFNLIIRRSASKRWSARLVS